MEALVEPSNLERSIEGGARVGPCTKNSKWQFRNLEKKHDQAAWKGGEGEEMRP